MRRIVLSIVVAVLVLGLAAVATVAQSTNVIEVPGVPPKLPTLRIVGSLDDWSRIVVNATGSANVSVSSGVVTIKGVARFILSDWFSYEVQVLNGSAKVGFVNSSGVEVVSYVLGPRSVVILHAAAVYAEKRKYVYAGIDEVKPFIEVNGTVSMVIKVLHFEVMLSAPAPPFEGTTWSGQCDPSRGGNVFIAERTIGGPGRYRIAFWERHQRSDVDLWIHYRLRGYSGGDVFSGYSLWADEGRWETIDLVAPQSYSGFSVDAVVLKVRQYRCPVAEPWMVVYQYESASTPTPTSTPRPTTTPSPTTPPVDTDSPAFKLSSISAKWIAIGVGILVVLILFAVIASHHHHRRW